MSESVDTLGNTLPREIARVRDEVLPAYIEIGLPGQSAVAIMRLALDLDPMANSLNVSNYVAAIQSELRAIAAQLCVPEYMLPGDVELKGFNT